MVPSGFHPVVLGRVLDQSAPTTADIQQALPRLESQLAADVVQFAFLRLVQVLVGGGEAGAGIDHAPVQPRLIEVVGDVVVVAGGLAVPFRRVATAAQADGAAPVPGAAAGRQAPKAVGQVKALPEPQGAFQQVDHQVGEGVASPLDVEVVVDVRLAQAIPIGRPEHPAQGAGVLEQEGEAGWLARGRPPGSAFPQVDGEIARAVVPHQFIEEGQGRLHLRILCPHLQSRHCKCLLLWRDSG